MPTPGQCFEKFLLPGASFPFQATVGYVCKKAKVSDPMGSNHINIGATECTKVVSIGLDLLIKILYVYILCISYFEFDKHESSI